MFGFLKALLGRYGEDDIAGRAAALAYFTIFSLGPLLFIIFGVLGQLLKSDQWRQRLLEQMQRLMGPEAGALINTAINNQNLSGRAGLAFFIGTAGLILGAIGIFGQLQKSFNAILHVKTGPDAGFSAKLRQKAISLALVGVVAFMLLVSLVASAAVTAATSFVSDGAITGFIFTLLDLVVSALVLGVLLAMVYRTLPDIKLPWKPLFGASMVVAALFSVGKIALGAIIGNNSSVTAFGAAGSLVALLLWVFYSGQIVYLGASGISLYADTHKVRLVPRYAGERGVLRVRKVEEPLEKPFWQGFFEDFWQSLKEAWRDNRRR